MSCSCVFGKEWAGTGELFMCLLAETSELFMSVGKSGQKPVRSVRRSEQKTVSYLCLLEGADRKQ